MLEMYRMRRGGKRQNVRAVTGILLAVFLLALVIAPSMTAKAAGTGGSQQLTTVKVGYFSNGDFMHKDADGNYSGYDIEYYYMIAGYAGWNIEFVEYDSLNSAQAALEKGEIDIMSGLSKTDERLSKYIVSNQKMCTANIAVQTRQDDDRFAAGDVTTMEDLKCGILKGSNVVALYADWCGKNGLTPHITEYDTLDERNEALASGEVDAIAAGSTIPGAQKIAEFPSLDLYFMLNRDRTDLKTQLDRAMNLLSLEDPTFAENLYSKYFPPSRNDSPSFSADEKAFIAAHPTIRVAVLEDDAPFSSVGDDGTVVGILPEYYAHVSQVVGSDFVCIPYATKDDACAALASGEVDAVGKFENDIFSASRRQLLLSVPYLKMNMVQITRAGTDEVNESAVPQCNAEAVFKALENEGSVTSMKTFINSEDCFAALKSGSVDSVICTQPAATWLLNRNRSSDYVVSSFGSETWEAACALPYGDDGNTLRSIMNKTITVDGGYMSQLITSGTLEDSADLANLFDSLPVAFLATAACVAVLLLVVAVAAIIILIRRRKAERLLADQRAKLDAAEETNKARHAFFGAVSHDMRTPLNGIIGFTDLALKSDDPEKIKNCLEKIRTSSAILNSLVNDTLIMSRMENGKYVLKSAPTSTTELLSEVLEPVKAMAEAKGVHFHSSMKETCPRCIMADRLSLQKIILNLLSNAVKYTPAGGTVSLECHMDEPDGDRPESVITVSDTGAGISKEFLPHVFEPFAQENPANADTSGSGLGLSIVKSIVDAMGGTISVNSEKGKGTTFTVRLHFDEAPQPETVDGVGHKKDIYSAVLEGKRALVCEDNVLNLEIVREILERSGMETVCAENGKIGLEMFEDSERGYFDVILLDLRMPVMDGMEAARAIRALRRRDAESVPIFAVSADAYPENISQCVKAGMNGHIAKPIDPDKLLAAVAGAVGK